MVDEGETSKEKPNESPLPHEGERTWFNWSGVVCVFADVVGGKLDGTKLEWNVENGRCFEVLESEQPQLPKGIRNLVKRMNKEGTPHEAVWFKFPAVHRPPRDEWQVVVGQERLGHLVLPKERLKAVGKVSSLLD